MTDAAYPFLLASIVSAIRRTVCLPGIPIGSDTLFREDLALGPVEIAEIARETAETFRIPVPAEAPTRFRTPADLVAHVGAHWKREGPGSAMRRAA